MLAVRVVLLYLALVGGAIAATTVCTVKDAGALFAPKTISWDAEKLSATVQMDKGTVIHGKVTLIQSQKEGARVNLVFHSDDSALFNDMEFIVFPISKTSHRVLGVGYQTVSGVRYLRNGLGNHECICSTQ